jgi:uncharacterized membrane protein (UPF0127 family)
MTVRGFEVQAFPGFGELHVARRMRSRLLWLALSRPRGHASLLIPGCRCIHTFGMLFRLDVVFLDASGRVIRVARDIGPGRVIFDPRAAGVIETEAGRSGNIRAMAEEHSNRFAAALDPRQPIYRDTYNEYFVLLLSIGGSIAGTQVPLYIVMALTDLWNVWIFVGVCVVFELAVIFGVARPQMKPHERAGWVVLWGAVTAIFAVLFYYLIAEPTL